MNWCALAAVAAATMSSMVASIGLTGFGSVESFTVSRGIKVSSKGDRGLFYTWREKRIPSIPIPFFQLQCCS